MTQRFVTSHAFWRGSYGLVGISKQQTKSQTFTFMQLNTALSSKEEQEQEKKINPGMLTKSNKSFQSRAEDICI